MRFTKKDGQDQLAHISYSASPIPFYLSLRSEIISIYTNQNQPLYVSNLK